jgi:hypothetical protein
LSRSAASDSEWREDCEVIAALCEAHLRPFVVVEEPLEELAQRQFDKLRQDMSPERVAANATRAKAIEANMPMWQIIYATEFARLMKRKAWTTENAQKASSAAVRLADLHEQSVVSTR